MNLEWNCSVSGSGVEVFLLDLMEAFVDHFDCDPAFVDLEVTD